MRGGQFLLVFVVTFPLFPSFFQYLESCDLVVFMHQGQLVYGSYQKLNSENVDFQQLLKSHASTEPADSSLLGKSSPPSKVVAEQAPEVKRSEASGAPTKTEEEAAAIANELGKKLIQAETMEKGAVGWVTYSAYAKAG
jgi:hypothetical protein